MRPLMGCRIGLALLQLLALQSSFRALPFYFFIYWICFEALQEQKARRYGPSTSLLLYLWLGLPMLVLCVRNRWMPYYFEAVEAYNTFEHLVFAVTLCAFLEEVSQLIKPKTEHPMRHLLVLIIGFNALGVINEIVQNAWGHLPLLDLDAADYKDLAINGLGSLAYGIAKQINKKGL